MSPGRWLGVGWSPHVHERPVAGRRVRYVDYGSGSPLVLVHGLGGSWTTWLENLPDLGEHHRVIAVDLPGFGGSEALPLHAELREHGETVAELLDALGIAAAVVVGHSLGGLVVLRLAGERPDLVRRLVLVDVGGVPLTPLRLAVIVRGFTLLHAIIARPGVLETVARRPRLRRLVLAGAVADPASVSPQLALETVPLMAAPGFLGAVAAAARAVSAAEPEAVRCPMLLLWGRQDRILPVRQAEALGDRLADARLQVFDDAAHCPMFEVPDAFDAALLAFAAA